jgi:hypothetical protein
VAEFGEVNARAGSCPGEEEAEDGLAAVGRGLTAKGQIGHLPAAGSTAVAPLCNYFWVGLMRAALLVTRAASSRRCWSWNKEHDVICGGAWRSRGSAPSYIFVIFVPDFAQSKNRLFIGFGNNTV